MPSLFHCSHILYTQKLSIFVQDILLASAQIPTAASLATKYRTNVAYNLVATAHALGVCDPRVAYVKEVGDKGEVHAVRTWEGYTRP